MTNCQCFLKKAGAACVLVMISCLIAGALTACAGKTEPASPSSSSSSTSVKEPVVVDKPFNVLLIGSDTRKGTAQYEGIDEGRGDILTIAHIDPTTHLISLVSVPRVTALSDDPNLVLLNDGLLQSPAVQAKQVEEVTGAKIDYYMETTFADFVTLVDNVGGITVDVPYDMSLSDPISNKKLSISAGEQNLTGAQALVLARTRKTFVDDDASRQFNVRSIEEALIKKAASSSKNDVEKYVSFLKEDVTTNIPDDVLLQVAKDFANNSDTIRFYSATGPYDVVQPTPDSLFRVPLDKETWGEIISLMEAGEDPSVVVGDPDMSRL